MEQAGSKAFNVRAGDGSIICVSLNTHRSVSTLRAMHVGIDKSFDTSLFGVPTPGEAETSLHPIRGHKIVLEHASKHLHDLLNSDDYTDSHQPVHHIENVDHDSLCRIINFIYTNELTLNAENAIEQMCGVIIGAKYLVMTNLSLAGECEAFLASHVNCENCVKLWCFARKYSCQALMHTTSSLLADDLAGMPSNGEFLRMPYKDLEELLPSEAFDGADVDQRCLAAVAWLEFDIVGRASHVTGVMNKIPLASVSAATARKLNECEMLWDHAPKTMRKLTNALIDRLDAEVESVSGGAGPNNAASWYVIGGLQKLFLQYNISERIWTTLPALPWDRRYFGACSGANRLMLMGGEKNDASTSGIDEYDLASKSWSTSTAKLRDASIGFEVCGNGQFVYALGSHSECVQKCCLRSNKIIELTSMLKNRIFYAAALANDCIYVGGGCGDFEGVVEKYDISNNQWAIVGNVLGKNRAALSGTITGDDFYLMGGQTKGGSTTDAVEIFNIRTGQSRTGQKLLQARTGCRATTMDNGNVVCVIGGREDGFGGLKSVETLDKREGKWLTGTIVPDMPKPAGYFGLATV